MFIYDQLGAQFVETTPTSCTMRTPVSDGMLQPAGVLHGGVSAYLAETCASQASMASLEGTGAQPAGLNLESTHLLPVFPGDTIETRARLVRAGGRTQVWAVEQVRLSDGEVFNVSQLTVYVKRPRPEATTA